MQLVVIETTYSTIAQWDMIGTRSAAFGALSLLFLKDRGQ